MNQTNIGNSGFYASSVILGCMRIGDKSLKECDDLIMKALELGINYFDHADIYAGGKSEELFGQVLKNHSGLRDTIHIQTKCAIMKGMYNFSKDHILESVDNSLKRLQTDYIDTLLLHRPDTLMEPEEVAEAFETLYASGKVRHFGVSNHNPMQIELLQKYIARPLIINQMQFGPMASGMIDQGLNVNMTNPPSVMHDGSILEYCRLNDITIQAWSPLVYGFFEGFYLENEKFPELNAALNKYASQFGVAPSAVVFAWILRHPAKIQPIAGTTNPEHLQALCGGTDISLSREQWYDIYLSAGHKLP